MSADDDDASIRERRERILGYIIGAPLIAFFLAYEIFGWVPPLPRVIAHGIGIVIQTLFAVFVSAVIFAWSYFFLMWVKRKWLRISVAALLGLYIGFSSTFTPGVSSDLVDGNCRPAGPGIYNDC
jgi:apolipoprotein N-acyltransferase